MSEQTRKKGGGRVTRNNHPKTEFEISKWSDDEDRQVWLCDNEYLSYVNNSLTSNTPQPQSTKCDANVSTENFPEEVRVTKNVRIPKSSAPYINVNVQSKRDPKNLSGIHIHGIKHNFHSRTNRHKIQGIGINSITSDSENMEGVGCSHQHTAKQSPRSVLQPSGGVKHIGVIKLAPLNSKDYRAKSILSRDMHNLKSPMGEPPVDVGRRNNGKQMEGKYGNRQKGLSNIRSHYASLPKGERSAKALRDIYGKDTESTNLIMHREKSSNHHSSPSAAANHHNRTSGGVLGTSIFDKTEPFQRGFNKLMLVESHNISLGSTQRPYDLAFINNNREIQKRICNKAYRQLAEKGLREIEEGVGETGEQRARSCPRGGYLGNNGITGKAKPPVGYLPFHPKTMLSRYNGGVKRGKGGKVEGKEQLNPLPSGHSGHSDPSDPSPFSRRIIHKSQRTGKYDSKLGSGGNYTEELSKHQGTHSLKEDAFNSEKIRIEQRGKRGNKGSQIISGKEVGVEGMGIIEGIEDENHLPLWEIYDLYKEGDHFDHCDHSDHSPRDLKSLPRFQHSATLKRPHELSKEFQERDKFCVMDMTLGLTPKPELIFHKKRLNDAIANLRKYAKYSLNKLGMLVERELEDKLQNRRSNKKMSPTPPPLGLGKNMESGTSFPFNTARGELSTPVLAPLPNNSDYIRKKNNTSFINNQKEPNFKALRSLKVKEDSNIIGSNNNSNYVNYYGVISKQNSHHTARPSNKYPPPEDSTWNTNTKEFMEKCLYLQNKYDVMAKNTNSVIGAQVI